MAEYPFSAQGRYNEKMPSSRSTGPDDPQTVPQVVASGIRTRFAFKWKQFTSAHDGWTRHATASNAVYCLPNPAIKKLSISNRKPVLEAPACAAELAFAELCAQFSAIGVLDGSLISCHYVGVVAPAPSTRTMEKMGWSKSEQLQVNQLTAKTQEITHRLKGYAGWLITDPDFIAERDTLRCRWRKLDAKERRQFVLMRSVRVTQRPQRTRRALADTESLAADFDTFCSHWGLTGMATWDLPLPQGPLLPAEFSANSPAMPSHGLHIVLPLHYPLKGSDDLLRQIQL